MAAGTSTASDSLANERVAYFNGEIVPESRAVVSFRDRSFKFGDGAFDTSRTFAHKLFKLDEHLDRFYRTLRYLQIDPPLTKDQFRDITLEVLERNLHLIDDHEDYWVSQRVSRGTDIPAGDIHESTGPTVIVECTPLPFKPRAPLFRDGIDVMVPSVRRASPEAFSPRAKTHNYLNLILGDEEIRRQHASGDGRHPWAILLDENGHFAEGMGSNIFFVIDGALVTPRDDYVLAGVTRDTVFELADDLGIPYERADIAPYDAYNADEAFITSTSFCICPVRSVSGVAMDSGGVPGPITKRLTDAFSARVGVDFVQQYLRHLD